MALNRKTKARRKRHRRVRSKVRGSATQPRLSIFRSNRGISAQLVDDDKGDTIVAAIWSEKDLCKLKPMQQAEKVGKTLAERAKKKDIEACVFDRGGNRYHGRVKAAAMGAREGGLVF